MTVYTPNIPQPNDNPSDSQDQILQNFQTLNTLYGTTGDHYPWTNTAAGTTTTHARVTLPRITGTNPAPGNVTPTPILNQGAIFTLTAAGQTIPYYRKDNITNNFPLLPVRAMGRFNYVTGAAIGTAFNLSVTAGANTTTPTLGFSLENMPDANYLVLLNTSRAVGGVAVGEVLDGSELVNEFQLRFSSAIAQYSVVVLHYA